MQLIANDNVALLVWDWCTTAYLHQGMKLTFPKDTDYTKTYQWRYVNGITAKFEEWGFDEQTAKRFIEIAVRHAKKAGILRKGLAILHQNNMLAFCYTELQKELKDNRGTAEMISESQRWVTDKIGTRTALQTLLQRPRIDGSCNLTIWYQGHKLTTLYLALSQSCYHALTKLAAEHKDERELLPSVDRLFLLRNRFLAETTNHKRAKAILGMDWRETCLIK